MSDLNVDAPTPRWVKVFGIVTVVVIVAFVILHLVGGRPQAH